MRSAADIEAEAAAWLAAADRGSPGRAEARLRDAWLNASTGHRVAFLRLQAAWDRLDALAGSTDDQSPGVRSGRSP